MNSAEWFFETENFQTRIFETETRIFGRFLAISRPRQESCLTLMGLDGLVEVVRVDGVVSRGRQIF